MEAARGAQMRMFSFGFLAKSQNSSYVLSLAKICNGKIAGLALLSLKKNKMHLFLFFTSLPLLKEITCFSPTIGGDGSREGSSDADVFVRVFS